MDTARKVFKKYFETTGGKIMGITLSSNVKSIDMGYFGFERLREKVAELTEPDIYEHYCKLTELFATTFLKTQEEKDAIFREYDIKTVGLDRKYNCKYSRVLDFLYSPDTGSVLTWRTCRDIYKIIKDYDDNISYGYAGREDCAMFKDFKEIVKYCMRHKRDMVWR